MKKSRTKSQLVSYSFLQGNQSLLVLHQFLSLLAQLDWQAHRHWSLSLCHGMGYWYLVAETKEMFSVPLSSLKARCTSDNLCWNIM